MDPPDATALHCHREEAIVFKGDERAPKSGDMEKLRSYLATEFSVRRSRETDVQRTASCTSPKSGKHDKPEPRASYQG
ncbi:hypothetical protein U9M48_002443 [Paspalum notatum var. saurae]|uniref:Uncharacterized protein n=1 Tax=Paspalum notatum var. saurae TaxID=547442 RepID=A0AAQ3SHG4_PASNO